MERDNSTVADPAMQVGSDSVASRRPTVDRITRLAIQTFGTVEKAEAWLGRPTTALSGASPLGVVARGEAGTEQVVDLLKRIDHGLAV